MITAIEAAKIRDAVLSETVSPKLLKQLLMVIDSKIKSRSSIGCYNTAFYLADYDQIYKHQYKNTIKVLEAKLKKLGYTVQPSSAGFMVWW